MLIKSLLMTMASVLKNFCGTNVELIMAMSGHTSYKSFKSYVKASLEEKADAIERIWDEHYKHLKDEEQP